MIMRIGIATSYNQVLPAQYVPPRIASLPGYDIGNEDVALLEGGDYVTISALWP